MDTLVRALGSGAAPSPGAVRPPHPRGRREAEADQAFEEELRRHGEPEAAPEGVPPHAAKPRYVPPPAADEIGGRIDLVA